jgi:phosphoglycerol transferase MdoB-like AlkP superfamily enzyme
MDLLPTILDLAGNREPHVSFGRSLLKKNISPFAIMSQGEDIHATDGTNCIVYGNVQNEPEAYKIKDRYFLEKTVLQNNSLKSAAKAYYQCSNRLFQENRFYPKSDC